MVALGMNIMNGVVFLDKWFVNTSVQVEINIKKINFSKEDLLIGGDFNVIENVRDALDFQEWENDALGNIKVRTKFRELCSLGLINLSRIFFKPGQIFSFWDYQRACWERNDGILIDHFLISPKKLQNVRELKYETSFRYKRKGTQSDTF